MYVQQQCTPPKLEMRTVKLRVELPHPIYRCVFLHCMHRRYDLSKTQRGACWNRDLQRTRYEVDDEFARAKKRLRRKRWPTNISACEITCLSCLSLLTQREFRPAGPVAAASTPHLPNMPFLCLCINSHVVQWVRVISVWRLKCYLKV